MFPSAETKNRCESHIRRGSGSSNTESAVFLQKPRRDKPKTGSGERPFVFVLFIATSVGATSTPDTWLWRQNVVCSQFKEMIIRLFDNENKIKLKVQTLKTNTKNNCQVTPHIELFALHDVLHVCLWVTSLPSSVCPQAYLADDHLHSGLAAVRQLAGSPRAGLSRLGGGSPPRTSRLLVRPAERHQRSHFTSRRRRQEIRERAFRTGRLGLSGWNLDAVGDAVAARRTKDDEWGRSVIAQREAAESWWIDSVKLCLFNLNLDTFPSTILLKLKDEAQQVLLRFCLQIMKGNPEKRSKL